MQRGAGATGSTDGPLRSCFRTRTREGHTTGSGEREETPASDGCCLIMKDETNDLFIELPSPLFSSVCLLCQNTGQEKDVLPPPLGQLEGNLSGDGSLTMKGRGFVHRLTPNVCNDAPPSPRINAVQVGKEAFYCNRGSQRSHGH